MAVDGLCWRSGFDYDEIRANREAARDAEVLRLTEMGGVFLEDYPDYIIFKNGDVFSTLCRKVVKLKPGKKKAGYRFIGLNKTNGERKYEMVHRLVAKTFIKNPENYPEVNHKDGNKSNNDASNLEWVTGKGNISHAIKTGLIKTGANCKLNDVADVVSVFKAHGKYRDIGKRFGVCAQTVCNIKKMKGYYGKRLEALGIVRVKGRLK